MANATALKFGHPHTLVLETDHWMVLTRPQQPTLGSLVLVCKEQATAFSQLSAEAFAGLQPVIQTIETALRRFVDYERINYLMLMMVDPDVHFHVLPRYADAKDFGGRSFKDAGWPGAPALGEAVQMEGEALAALTLEVRRAFDAAAGVRPR